MLFHLVHLSQGLSSSWIANTFAATCPPGLCFVDSGIGSSWCTPSCPRSCKGQRTSCFFKGKRREHDNTTCSEDSESWPGWSFLIHSKSYSHGLPDVCATALATLSESSFLLSTFASIWTCLIKVFIAADRCFYVRLWCLASARKTHLVHPGPLDSIGILSRYLGATSFVFEVKSSPRQ